MKKLVKTAAAVIFAVTAICSLTLVNAYGDISVRMDGIVSDGSFYVPFDDIKPVQLDSRTLIPARSMAEAASMAVTWDQPTQTAILTLKADIYSDKPVERYAAQLISMVDAPWEGLTPVFITAALTLGSDTAVIRYNFIDGDGDYIALGKEYGMLSKAILVDGGRLMIPLRDSMEMFGLNVGWNQEEFCAYVTLPDFPRAPDGLRLISNHGEGEYSAAAHGYSFFDNYSYEALRNGAQTAPQYVYNDGNAPQLGEYIGTFKITHYCPCSICNGGWGSNTAWAGAIIPGQTIATNPDIIPPLSWVYVDGYGLRRAEDTGDTIDPYHIDMAVPTHAMAMSMGVVYKDVYRVY